MNLTCCKRNTPSPPKHLTPPNEQMTRIFKLAKKNLSQKPSRFIGNLLLLEERYGNIVVYERLTPLLLEEKGQGDEVD